MVSIILLWSSRDSLRLYLVLIGLLSPEDIEDIKSIERRFFSIGKRMICQGTPRRFEYILPQYDVLILCSEFTELPTCTRDSCSKETSII